MSWYNKYSTEISFFIAGWCALAALTDLAKGDYVWAVINSGLVYLNIRFSKPLN
jgi:hypothetical protein